MNNQTVHKTLQHMPKPSKDNSPSRHIDTGSYLWQYANNSLVRCIECDTIGQIIVKNTPCGAEGCCCRRRQFICQHCQLTLLSNKDWVAEQQLVAYQPCYRCGVTIKATKTIPYSYKVDIPDTLPATCPNCHRHNHLMVNRYHRYDGNLGIDPYFGLPLFLRTDCRFGTIWAFNQAHLKDLQHFTHAKHRERNTQAGNGSMISRLPAWLKSNKNRDLVSKKLAELQRKLDDYQSLSKS